MFKLKKQYIYYSILTLLILSFIIIGIKYINFIFNNKKTLINYQLLDKSLDLGTKFLINNQKEEGNFNYEYNWITKKFSNSDNDVRQAGALWGLALIYNDKPSNILEKSIIKGIDFFEKHSVLIGNNERYIKYPNSSKGSTGTIALLVLTYIDFLRSVKDQLEKKSYEKYIEHLNQYINFILKCRMKNGLWFCYYNHDDGKPSGEHSPYFDGESLLALIKAVNYMGREDIKDIIIESAEIGYKTNIQEALNKNPDSSITKGYYQWSSMAFFEIYKTGWENTDKYLHYVIELAYWMIDVHKTLQRGRNTGYAYEGIIHAYEAARLKGNKKAMKKFKKVINIGLTKLTSWQVGSPIANIYIQKNKTTDPLAIGGVQNHKKEDPLRIDVTQHQMHAVILAKKYVYKK